MTGGSAAHPSMMSPPALELELKSLLRQGPAGQFVGKVPGVDGADTVHQAVDGLRLEAPERVGFRGLALDEGYGVVARGDGHYAGGLLSRQPVQRRVDEAEGVAGDLV